MISITRSSNVFSSSGSPGKRTPGLSPLKATASAQQQLDAVVSKIESKRAIHERCMLELRKAGELVKSLERELRYACSMHAVHGHVMHAWNHMGFVLHP